MNSNQRSEGNNQSHNGSNELDMNSARAGTADRNNIDPATQRGSEQAGSQQAGGQSGGMQSGSQQSGGQQSGQPGTDRGMQERGTYEETGGQPSGAHQPGFQNADAGNQQGTDRSGSQTGNQQSGNQQSGNLQSGSQQSGSQQSGNQQSGNLQSNNLSPGNLQGDASDGRITNEAGKQGGEMNRQSNDSAGGLPRSPAGNRQSADQKMDDDTGLSNTVNREPSELDQNLRQERQSNVGRRSDGTPD